jgi:hypothetical protein
VTVDEAREGAESAPVELFELAAGVAQCRAELAHGTESRYSPVFAQDVRVTEDGHVRERAPAKRRVRASRRRELGEVADEQSPPAGDVFHSADLGRIGGSSP